MPSYTDPDPFEFWDEDANGTLSGPAVSPDNLIGDYPGHIRAVSNGSVVASIDPTNTTTGLQDAIDAINAATGAGRVELPPYVEQNGSVSGAGNIAFIGRQADGSVIEFTDLTVPGIVIDSNADAANSFWHNIKFGGSDKSNRDPGTGAFDFNSNVRRFDFGRVWFSSWDGNTDANGNGGVIDMAGGHPFSSTWFNVRFGSGSYNGHAIYTETTGPALNIINLYTGNADQSTDVLFGSAGGGYWKIGTWNIGGNTDVAGSFRSQSTIIGTINYETGNSPAAVISANNGRTVIKSGSTSGSSPDYFYTATGTVNNDELRVGGGSIANVEMDTDTSKPMVYYGAASEVDNTSGSELTAGVYCVSDAAVKHSTGTGLDPTIDKLIPQYPLTSSQSPGFDTWTQASATRPAIIEVGLTAETDGTSNGQIAISVDRTGGTTPNYTFVTAFADSNNPSGTEDRQLSTIYLPAGAQYIIDNQSDPNAANSIDAVQKLVL